MRNPTKYEVAEAKDIANDHLNKVFPKVTEALNKIITEECHGIPKSFIASAWIHMLVDIAREFSGNMGIKPGDFAETLRTLATITEQKYGTERDAVIEIVDNSIFGEFN